jgi:type IV secretion system protein VirB8
MREPELDAYFAEALTWDADRVAMRERSARIAWRISALALFLTVLLSLALMMLMPLKRTEPFVIRVDSSTGLVDVVPVYSGHASMPEAVTRYFLEHYVRTCERFNFSTAESDYEECGAFHAPQRNQLWYSAWAKTNPSSPLNLYRDGTTIEARITSLSFFTRADGVADLAQVRYLKAKHKAGGSDEQLSHWIASIRYTYAKPSQEPKTRAWNPLGFKILEFHVEPEVLSEEAAPKAGGTPVADPSQGGAVK